ncbi:MAG: hypothetical protein ACK5JS_01355 [Mangrovibacterium sp.]
MDANVLNKRNELIEWLSNLEDTAIIEKLSDFRKRESSDWWNTISEEERISIERGIADADNMQLETHEEA